MYSVTISWYVFSLFENTLKSSKRLANFFRLKDKIPLCLHSNIVYKFTCGRCNATYYDETCHHFKVKVGKHSGISPLTNKRSKSKTSTAIKDHMLIYDQPVSFDDFKVLASSNSEFHLKTKESLILQSYNYLVLPLIHCYLLFVAFSDKYMLQ